MQNQHTNTIKRQIYTTLAPGRSGNPTPTPKTTFAANSSGSPAAGDGEVEVNYDGYRPAGMTRRTSKLTRSTKSLHTSEHQAAEDDEEDDDWDDSRAYRPPPQPKQLRRAIKLGTQKQQNVRKRVSMENIAADDSERCARADVRSDPYPRLSRK